MWPASLHRSYQNHCYCCSLSSRWIFSLGAAYLASWTFISFVVFGNPIDESGSLTRFIGMLLMLVLAVWKNERFHAAAVMLACILQATWLVITVSTI